MKETEGIRDMLDLDPMEQLAGIKQERMERFKKMFRVTSCSRVRTGHDYCGIDAVVTFGGETSHPLLQLTFRYERKRPEDDGTAGCQVWYSIQMSKNYQQKEKLLVVQVWAPKTVPSAGEAVCINQPMDDDDHGDDENDSNEDGWEDIDDGVETGNAAHDANELDTGTSRRTLVKEQMPTPVVDDEATADAQKEHDIGSKRRKVNDHPKRENGTKGAGNALPAKAYKQTELDQSLDCDDEEEETATNKNDSYMVHLDPDLLHEFLKFTGLQSMDEGTAFFLLMTFPFYEQEWDLVGYVLDEIFGAEGDEGGHDDE